MSEPRLPVNPGKIVNRIQEIAESNLERLDRLIEDARKSKKESAEW